MLDQFFEIHARLAENVGTRFKRFLFDRMDWNVRLLALVGPRGVGKTTMLLQHYKETFDSPEQCLFVSADNIRVQAMGLFELASEFFKSGGGVLMLDEVHKYAGWALEVKNIYDSFPKARMVVSGSSTLDILAGRADLSRRMLVHRLPCLSFREFLTLETGTALDSLTLESTLSSHTKLASALLDKLGGVVSARLRDYFSFGCYPFYLEGRQGFHSRLENVLEKIVSDDIPSVYGVRP